MGKRKEDQRRDGWSSSSSSLDAKRRRPRHYQNGPHDGMPRDGFRDAFVELKDALLAKFSTEGNFKRKIEKLKEKRKKDKNKHEEDLRILKEDLRKLKDSHEDLKSKIQEMRKEGSAEASPQSQLSQSTTFRLIIENRLCTPIYKNEMVQTEDGGGHIKVVLYDGGSPIAPNHSLASAKVELVVIEGRFNNDKRESWSKEEFEKSIITPREGMARLVKNGTFDLIGGSCDHQGAIIMDNSQKKEVRLGVMIAMPTEERVIEGVSNLFRVQEVKTKRSRKNGAYGPSHPPPTVPLMVEGNDSGQALNGNGQNISRQIPVQMQVQSASPYPMQNVQFGSCAPPNDFQAAVNQHLPSHGQDQSHQSTSFPNRSSELAHQNPSTFEWLNDIQPTFSPGDVRSLNAQTQMQETLDWSFRCCRVLLQWDKPRVDLSERWNFFDQLMPLYSTKSRFYGESFLSTSLIDKAHKLPGSISSVGSVWKMMTSVTGRATQTSQKRGVLIRPIDSDDEPPFNQPRSAKYQLRFVNRVCSDYYTREKIKSEDGAFLKVALYDENNLVVTSGPLSSAYVVVVLLHGDFNAEGQDYWTHEEFIASSLSTDEILYLGGVPLGGDRLLALTDGEADLANIDFRISSSLARTGKFKMGIQIKYVVEETVQEGITSSFVVRVRKAEELGCHQITPLEQLLGVRTELPNEVLGPQEYVATQYLGTSSLQQLASNNITTTPSPAAAGGGGGGGGGNNHPHDGSMATAAEGGGGGGGGGEGDGDGGPNKPMSMSERARLARVPQPEPGLNCPRCDSTNTKFCYFNNYSLTQPRHFCRACRRYWTRGGALRNVPVGGGYRRHAKRAKPKTTASGAAAAAAGTASSGSTATTPSSTTCTGSATAAAPQGFHQYSAMFGANSAPPTHSRFADGFDPASLGLSFPARLLFGDSGAYASDGTGHNHQGNGMEQWASMAQMQGFPFLHAMDHQMAGNPPPTTMAAMQGMFHLGLQSGGGGGNSEDGGGHQFQHHATTPAAKREHHQQAQHHPDYPSSRGMYGDVINGGGGYNFYSTASNAAGN